MNQSPPIQSKRSPPGPQGHWLVGNLPEFGRDLLGFLSRCAREHGTIVKFRLAGWTAYLYYGYDQATARDARRFGARGSRSDLFSGNIQYKLNSFITFAYEQGLYRTRAANRAGALPLFRGVPSYTTHDLRSELAAIFTF